jgi:tripartite-type tricarboxylate transporter receptor subunit TctC
MTISSTLLRCAGVFVALVGALLAAPPAADAQAYPSQDVHFICAFPAGSGADVIVRYYADKMRLIMNHTIIVENKAGALGNIAMEYVARSKPDGHTIFIHGGSAVAANMHLFKNPSVDAGKAIQIVSTVNKQATMLVVAPNKPWKTVAELTAYLKEKRDKATYATSNPIATVMGEMYKQIAGLDAVEVNYRTGMDTLNDIASGAVDYSMVDNVFALSQAREGRLRILAVSTGKRLEANADIPTMDEAGVKGMDLTSWWATMVPSATPRPIVDQLNKWFNQVEATEETKKFMNQFGADPWVTSPDEGQAFFLKQIDQWGDYVKIAKIEPQG